MQTERRVRRFELPYHIVANLLLPKDVYTRITDVDLPEDAKIIHVEPDHPRSMFIFYVRSEKFEEIPPGEVTPTIYPVFHIRCLERKAPCPFKDLRLLAGAGEGQCPYGDNDCWDIESYPKSFTAWCATMISRSILKEK